MLERSPELDYEQIFSLLTDHAVSDEFTGQTPNPTSGFGKIYLADLFQDSKFPERKIPDTSAPVISEISVKFDRTSILISWKTDEIASSRVEVRLDDEELIGEFGTQSYTFNHQVEITELDPGTNYQITIFSTDPSGNRAESDELSCRTEGDSPGCACSWEIRENRTFEWGRGVVEAIFLLGFIFLGIKWIKLRPKINIELS
jgi:hypothetical protein